jgi:hypothetical protein
MKNLFKALAGFQQECPVVHKGTKGYGYSYASLPEIFEVINPLLKKHGLGFTQLLTGSTIKTMLFHIESGEVLDSVTEIPINVTLKGMNEFQVAGSSFTYYRRYALSSMLGIVTDVDNDASGTQTKSQPVKKPASNENKSTLTYQQWEKAMKDFTANDIKKVLDNFKMTEQFRKELTKRLNDLTTK